jgi:GTPase SAR1 family protein
MPLQHSTSSIRRKLVIVGDGHCGKTSLLHAFSKKEFLNNHEPTS